MPNTDLPRCNRCGGLLMGGFRCLAPACNHGSSRGELVHELLQDQREILQARFVGERVKWETAEKRISGGSFRSREASVYYSPLENGEAIVRDVRIYHGQIFYYFEDRDEGVKRSQLREWEVLDEMLSS